jgi:hypothetical protein
MISDSDVNITHSSIRLDIIITYINVLLKMCEFKRKKYCSKEKKMIILCQKTETRSRRF